MSVSLPDTGIGGRKSGRPLSLSANIARLRCYCRRVGQGLQSKTCDTDSNNLLSKDPIVCRCLQDQEGLVDGHIQSRALSARNRFQPRLHNTVVPSLCAAKVAASFVELSMLRGS